VNIPSDGIPREFFTLLPPQQKGERAEAEVVNKDILGENKSGSVNSMKEKRRGGE
jgi:hypothetical protein